MARLLVSICLCLTSFTSSVNLFAQQHPAQRKSLTWDKASPKLKERFAPRALEQFAVYWTDEPGWHSELQLRNNLPSQQLSVTPYLRSADGAESALPLIQIPPDDVVTIDGATSQVHVTAKAKSQTANDVSITVTVAGQASDPFKITVRAPYAFGVDPLNRVPTYYSNATYTWENHVLYQVRDNFLDPMPTDVPINENWTTTVQADWTGNNWRRGDPGCTTAVSFYDLLGGETSSRVPTPVYNTSQNGSAVQHWGQEWRVGTCLSGSGPRVQTDTIQKYTDHAVHTSISSPAP